MPRQNHKLPKATLTHDEVEVVLAVPDITTPDRAPGPGGHGGPLRHGHAPRASWSGLDLPDVDLTAALADAARHQDPLGPGGADGRAGSGRGSSAT